MAETATGVREIIDDSLDLLKRQNHGTDSQRLMSRLESVRSVLIRNEKKIWLRTKKGRGMLVEVNEALARAIEEESRKRSMVVT